jgi:hypothetical protein
MYGLKLESRIFDKFCTRAEATEARGQEATKATEATEARGQEATGKTATFAGVLY